MALFWISLFLFGTIQLCFSQSRIPHVMEVDDRFPEMKKDLPWLLEFYAPWCGYCKKLAPIYDRVASDLDGTGIRVAKIDATQYSNVASEYEVQGFPTIIFIKGDTFHVYRGDRTAEKMKEFAIRANSPPVHPMASESSLILLKKQKPTFFIYVGEEGTSAFSVYERVAQNYSLKVDFFSGSESKLSRALQSSVYPAIFVVRTGKLRPYLGHIAVESVDELSAWVRGEMYGAMPSVEGADFYDLMAIGKHLVLVVAPTDSKRDHKVRAASKKLMKEVMPLTESTDVTGRFQFVNMEDSEIVSNIILGECPVPYLVVFEPISHQYFLPSANLSMMRSKDIESFLGDVVTGNAEALGGTGFLARIKKMLYSLLSTVTGLWRESKLLFAMVVCMPLAVVALVSYTICCVSWEDEEEQPGEDLSGSEGEGEGRDSSPEMDDGHLKKE